MQCLKCGHQNFDDAKFCQCCNSALPDKDAQPPKPTAKTSKLAILSLVLGIFSLFLFVFTGIPAIILGIVSYYRIKYSDGVLKGKPILIVGMILTIVFMFGFILLWRLDAPPIPNDYTIADLRSAPADCTTSYELLKYLTDPNNNLIEQSSDSNTTKTGISKAEDRIIAEISYTIDKGNAQEISELLSDNADIIQQAWDKTEKAREIIDQLNEFPEIADLHNPNFTHKLMRPFLLIDISRLYQVYAHLQNKPEGIHNITMELIELDSVFRKFCLNTRLLALKLICYHLLEKNILTANILANNPETSQESQELLVEHFQPLTKEQMSIKNPLLFEYLFMKQAVSESPKENIIKVIPELKANSTLRLYRNYCDDLINALEDDNNTLKERLKVCPALYPFKEPVMSQENETMPFLYTCYNPAGSLFLQMIDLNRVCKTVPGQKLNIIIWNDLLQIVINKRLGKEVDLKARAYSDQYIIDIENKKIFSPGPDGKARTKDDIALPINPEVLGLTE
jgi:hypothetical protein